MKIENLIIGAFIILVGLLIIPNVNAENVQPTQQFNKIFMSPFYRDSLTGGTNYTYNLTVNPPDGISSVKSAIIVIDSYISPTRTFWVWVNNQSCNNPSYVVSTTYATAGKATVYFDCSNRINKAGIYDVKVQVTSLAVGSTTAWLDLTYMNNPIGGITVSGTEYSPNDPATMFVQLKDAYGNAVQNGSCYLDIWSPLNATGQHPYSTQDAPMLPALGDDGMYYYDTTAPQTLGVYMLSAKCAYSYNWQWIYPESELVFSPTAQRTSGTWTGSTLALNNKQDDIYERCDATAPAACISNYTYNTTIYGFPGNVTTINFYFAGQGDIAAKTVTFAYWNGTSFVNLVNTWVTAATGATATVPGDVDQFVSNTIPISAIIGGEVKIRITTPTGLARYYHNWMALALLTSSGTIQEVKGSSEMHVTNLSNAVWNNPSRNLTYYPTITNATLSLSPTEYNNIIGGVWNATTRNLTYYPPQTDMTNYSRVSNLTANDIWNYNGTVNPSLLSQFSTSVWNMFNSTYNFISLITESVWSRSARNLTYYPNTQVNITNNITFTPQINVTVNTTTQVVNVQNVTVNVTTQNVTVQNVTINLTTQNVTVQNVTVNVQNVTTNITTQIVNVQNVTVNATTEIVNVTLNTTVVNVQNVTNNITTQIVNVTTQVVDVQNITVNVTTQVINVTIQNVTVQNMTVNVTTVGVNLNDIQGAVWNATDRNLTYYPNTQINITNNVTNNITLNPIFNITNNVSVNLNSSDIADAVWNYNGTIAPNILNQFTTSFWGYTGNMTIVVNQIAQEVWNWPYRYTHGEIYT